MWGMGSGQTKVHSAIFPMIAFKQPGRVLLVGWCDAFQSNSLSIKQNWPKADDVWEQMAVRLTLYYSIKE